MLQIIAWNERQEIHKLVTNNWWRKRTKLDEDTNATNRRIQIHTTYSWLEQEGGEGGL